MTITSQEKSHASFKFIREQKIDSLNVLVQEFEHIKTGAQHIHLQADNQENVFLVALRTLPKDSTGVAHILEHTTLCGSKKYPVRDPFFMMTRRSLNTFMNAMTSSDWTAYPFASLNKKDFNNLLDVYLDAVFFARLDPLDFAQEGHRIEFSEPTDSESPLTFKGVVFNEMKGAMSSISSQLWQTLSKYVFPTSTYHFNSGGEPADIPDLSYEQLVDFYKVHYHPSNAIFMTYGDIPAAVHQEKFESQALSQFERLDKIIDVPDEKRYFSPIRVQESYPKNDGDLSEQTHVVMSWLLGNSTNLEETLRAQLLSSILLDNSASPLMLQLESTDLGSAPSPLCGLDDSQKELTFMCGLSGCTTDASDKVETLILDTIQSVIDNGIPKEDIESALHQLELHQREIGGDSYPYGMQLIFSALTSATHRGDPVRLLDIDGALAQLRKDIESPDFIKQLAKELLIDNSHRVRLTLTPDPEMADRKEKAEKQRLAKIQKSLTDDDKKNIVDLAAALKARQESVDDESLLPKVTLDDVPEKEVSVTGEKTNIRSIAVNTYPTATNGILYQQVIFDLPEFNAAETALLPLYTTCATELGVGDKTYLDMQKNQASVSGSFSAFSSIRGSINDVQKTHNYLTFSAKALNRNHLPLSQLMAETITNARFDEVSRIKELVSQMRIGREQRLTGSGHALAMTAASAGMSGAAKIAHDLTGLAATQTLKALDKALENDTEVASLSQQLTAIHQKVNAANRQMLVIGEEQQLNDLDKHIEPLTQLHSSSSNTHFHTEPVSQKIQQAWLTNSQVNFCAKAYATVPSGHEDSAILVVLGGFLRNGILHKTIREQGGAYGGGATQDSNNGCFRFYSYRDPRIEETLLDFDQSIQWLLNEKHSAQSLEEAILGTISSIDRSESPAGRAKRCFHAELSGRTVEHRQLFRERVLATRIEDMQRVAEIYLKPELASTAIITDLTQRNRAENLGLNIIEL